MLKQVQHEDIHIAQSSWMSHSEFISGSVISPGKETLAL